jgi:hypothetical protein
MGLGTVNSCAGEVQQQLYKTDTSSRQRGCLKGHHLKCSVRKKITGRDSQGACRQEELICGKPPVVK